MKKIISIIACLALLLSLALCVSATVAPTVTSKASTNKLKVGETVTITVTLKDTQKVTALAITPEFDDTAFEIVSGEWLIKDPLMSDFNGADAVAVYAEDTYCNTDIFKFVLRAKSVPVFADSKISVKLRLQNSDYNGDIEHDTVGCSVTVESAVKETTPPVQTTQQTTPVKPPVQQTTPPAKDTTSAKPPVQQTTPATESATDGTTDVTTAIGEATDTMDTTEQTNAPATKGETAVQSTPDTEDIQSGDISGKSNDSIIVVIIAIVAVIGIGVVIYIRKKRGF